MKNAWKGTTDDEGDLMAGLSIVAQNCYEKDGGVPPADTPVLVIDATDFPDDYPMPESEWLWGNRTAKILSQPFKDLSTGQWRVAAFVGLSLFHPLLANLKPIPTEATGEVVGGFEIVAGARTTLDMPTLGWGKYDIIRRES